MSQQAVTKVFGIGFQKTGTTTLRKALEQFDYRIHGGGPKMLAPLNAGDFEPIDELVQRFDGFQDHPWPLLYRQLDAKYPGSRFVLTLRDENDWLKSVINHFGFYPNAVQKFTYGIGFPVGFEDVYLQTYRQHNQSVMDYFKGRKQDLLVVDWQQGDGWEALCSFLGKPIPDTPFPHARRGDYRHPKTLLWDVSRPLVRLLRSAGALSVDRQYRPDLSPSD